MNRKTEMDWTDALRETLEKAQLTPSEDGWQRLEADMHPRKSVHWPYYVLAAAACATVCGVFLFRTPSSDSRIELVEPGIMENIALQSERDIVDFEEIVDIDAGTSDIRRESRQLDSELKAPVVKVNTTDIPVQADSISVEHTLVPESECAEQSQQPQQPERHEQKTGDDSEPASDKVLQQLDDFAPHQNLGTRRHRRKVSVSLSAGGSFGAASGRTLLAQSTIATKAGDVMDITEVIQHSTPLNVNLDVFVPLSRKLGIDTGVDVSSLNSYVGNAQQTMRWIGVPLKLDYQLGHWGPCSVNLGAGVRGEKCLSALLLGIKYNEQFQWAGNVSADCRVSLFGPVNLLLSPQLDYYFTDTILPTYRTGRPLSFRFCAGLAFDF